MGYAMPQVIKAIYIPCDEEFLNNDPSLEEYKEKYGIDLEKVLNIKIVTSAVPRIEMPKNTKVYLVAGNYADLLDTCPKVAMPNFIEENSAEHKLTIGVTSLTYTGGNLATGTGFGFIIADDRTLSPVVI